mmetsp:Transcript_22331/g.62030  ORF Transcript_22331/g.62030 Transcript_22331/m.62030 type:complete len:327 (+) Transcript_22331:130-1110(+)
MRVDEAMSTETTTTTSSPTTTTTVVKEKRLHDHPITPDDDDSLEGQEKPAKRSRRRRLDRHDSELRVGGADEEVEEDVVTTSSTGKTKKSKRRTEAVSFVDLLNAQMASGAGAAPPATTTTTSSASTAPPKKRILKLPHDNTTKRRLRKRVRFATNEATKKVWTLVRTYRKEPKSRHDQLWWTGPELEQRSEIDEQVATQYEEQYSLVLQHGYESISSSSAANGDDDGDTGTVNMTFDNVQACSEARGLETDCYVGISNLIRSHRKKVLNTQHTIKDEKLSDSKTLSDFELKLLSQQSLKGSQKSTVMARQMGEFDQQALTAMDES